MIGQGRPASMPVIRARALRRALEPRRFYRFAAACALALVATWCTAEPALAQGETPAEPLRLRISWGGGEPSQWSGRILVRAGTLADLRLHGANVDDAASIWLHDNEVRVTATSAHARNAVEVSVFNGAISTLVVELSNSAAAEPVTAEVPLADVVRNPYSLKLDERGNTLKVESADNPGLQISFEREPLIFAPGEQLTLDVQLVVGGLAPGTTLDLQTTLVPISGKTPPWSDEQRLAVPVDGPLVARLNIPIPRAEGVYSVGMAATRPSGFRERFFPGAAVPLAERTFQLAVVAANRQTSGEDAIWETVLEIDPTNPHWWERLPSWTQLRRIPGLKSGPLGSIRAGSVNYPSGRFVELPPTAATGEPHWQAYSLPLEAVGLPHELEITYPIGEEQHFGLSIVEADASGAMETISLDTGVYVEGLGRGEATQPATYRAVFWPRTQAPLLLVTNRHPTAGAHFGAIRVRKRSTNQLAAVTSRQASGDRLVAAYIGHAQLAEMFGLGRPLAQLGGATSSNNTQHDWQLPYQSVTRLADYLQYAGYNGAVITALGEGRTMYHSALLLRGPVRHAGALSSDATEVDSLELLLRVFDREQLALLPALQFDAPLPELERLRRGSDPHTSGLEWVGQDGRTWLDTNASSNGRAPYYNLLDPRVQQAMARAVAELLERYGHHSAFAGVAVQLSSDGYAQLLPLDWGLDDATTARFAADTGLTIDASGANRFAARHAQLTGPYADAWRSWRAARVTEFYSQLAALVRVGNERRRLLLTTEHSLDHPKLAARIRPNILAANRVNATLLDLGIVPERLRETSGLVFCATRYEGPTVPLRNCAVDLQINDAFEATTRQADNSRPAAALFFHRPHPLRLAPLAKRFEFASEAWLASQPVAHGAMVRQPYAKTLAADDFSTIIDGGKCLPVGQEELLRPARLILQQLPTAAEQFEILRQPVFVRTYSEANRTTLLVVNTCPWQTDANFLLALPQPTALEPLVKADSQTSMAVAASQTLDAGQQPWTVSLGPYEIQAVQIATGDVRIVDVQSHASPAANAELARQLSELSNRDTAPRVYRSLANPSFEPIGGGVLPGWQLVAGAATTTAELDATMPHDGKSCLYIQSGGQSAVLESNAFHTPATGQLALTVFARAKNLSPQTELRLVIEADNAGYGSRWVVLGGGKPEAYPLSEQWRCYPILVNDLPLEPNGQMRIKFELTGPGEIWLDEAKTFDLLFPLSFYKYSQTESLQMIKEIQAAQEAFKNGEITDCVRRLEGYWPRFRVAYTPPITPPIVQQPSKPPERLAAPAEPKKEPAPGFSEKFKWLVPKWR